jgi:hypothetical protein
MPKARVFICKIDTIQVLIHSKISLPWDILKDLLLHFKKRMMTAKSLRKLQIIILRRTQCEYVLHRIPHLFIGCRNFRDKFTRLRPYRLAIPSPRGSSFFGNYS